METNLIEVESIKGQVARAHDALATAQSLVVTDQASYDRGMNCVKLTMGYSREVDKKLADLVDPLKSTIKKLQAIAFPAKSIYKQAEDLMRQKLTVFYDMEELKRQIAEKELQAVAELAEQNRQAKLAAVIDKAEKSGAIETAVSALFLSEQLPPEVKALPTFVPQEGTAKRTYWSGEVVDMKALLRAILDGKADINLVQGNKKFIHAMASGSKGGSPTPGIKWTARTGLAIQAEEIEAE